MGVESRDAVEHAAADAAGGVAAVDGQVFLQRLGVGVGAPAHGAVERGAAAASCRHTDTADASPTDHSGTTGH